MTELELRALAEMVADVLVERGIVGESPAPSSRVLDAAAVARRLGRERQWVYDHARELGAFRYGDGPRARPGFDAHAIERWKRDRQSKDFAVSSKRTLGPPIGGTRLIPYEGSGRGA